MLENADGPDDFAVLDNPDLAALATGAEIARVPNDLFCLYSFTATGHTHKLAVRVGNDLLNLFIEHVGAPVDGAKAGKRLGQLPETVQGVNVWRLAISGHRRGVEDNAVVSGSCGFRDIAVGNVMQQPDSTAVTTYSSSRYSAMAWPIKS